MNNTSNGGEKIRVLSPFPYLIPPAAPFALAGPLGFAQEEGLEVEIVDCGIPGAAVTALLQGRGDVTIVNTVFNFSFRERGEPLRSFFGYLRRMNRSFVVPEESGIRDVKDLSGKQVGLFALDHLKFARAALAEHGVDAEAEVDFKVYRNKRSYEAAEMIEALRKGEIAAIWLLDVLLGHFMTGGAPIRSLPSPRVESLTPSACLYSTDETLQRRQDALTRFGRAIAKTQVFCIANPEAAVRLLWKHVPQARPQPDEDESLCFKRDLVSTQARMESHKLREGDDQRYGFIDGKGMQRWQEFLLETGEIKQKLPLEEHYENGFADAYNDFNRAEVIERARNVRS